MVLTRRLAYREPAIQFSNFNIICIPNRGRESRTVVKSVGSKLNHPGFKDQRYHCWVCGPECVIEPLNLTVLTCKMKLEVTWEDSMM